MTASRLLAAFLCAAMEFQRRRRYRTSAEDRLHDALLRYAWDGIERAADA